MKRNRRNRTPTHDAHAPPPRLNLDGPRLELSPVDLRLLQVGLAVLMDNAPPMIARAAITDLLDRIEAFGAATDPDWDDDDDETAQPLATASDAIDLAIRGPTRTE